MNCNIARFALICEHGYEGKDTALERPGDQSGKNQSGCADPGEYRILLDVARNHYGVSKRTEELLVELHHPFVNWEYVLTQLKSLSIGDFYDFNTHEEGLSALKKLADIYLTVIASAGDEEVRDNAVRYCFEYLNTILSRSNNLLERNTALFSPVFRSLADLSRNQRSSVKKIIELYESDRQADDGESDQDRTIMRSAGFSRPFSNRHTVSG